MRCNVTKGYQYPYCKLTITFQTIRDGLDLTDFSHFTIDAGYEGPGAGKVNLMVANAEEGMTRLDKWETFKINQIDYLEIPKNGHMLIPMKWFGVAPWWKELAKPSIEHSFVRMDNVTRLEIMNAVGTPEGQYTLTVRSIKAPAPAKAAATPKSRAPRASPATAMNGTGSTPARSAW